MFFVTPELTAVVLRGQKARDVGGRLGLLSTALCPWACRPDVSQEVIDALNAACDLAEKEMVE